MTASEVLAEQFDAESGLERGAIPIAAWVLLLQFAAQCLLSFYPDSELAARSLVGRWFERMATIRSLKREARRAGIRPRLRQRAAETVYDQSVKRATSELLMAVKQGKMACDVQDLAV